MRHQNDQRNSNIGRKIDAVAGTIRGGWRLAAIAALGVASLAGIHGGDSLPMPAPGAIVGSLPASGTVQKADIVDDIIDLIDEIINGGGNPPPGDGGTKP